jgi:hypothetical protein
MFSKSLAKKTLAVSASLALAFGGAFALSGSASAAGTSHTLDFETGDTIGLAAAGFEGMTAAVSTFGPTGDALSLLKGAGGQPYSGANLILDTDGLQLASNANTVVTLDFYSDLVATIPVMLKIQTDAGWPGGRTCMKAVEAAPGWHTLSFDFATATCKDTRVEPNWDASKWINTGYDATANYKLMAIFPDFAADDPSYTGAPAVTPADQEFFIDNVVVGTSATLAATAKVTGPSKKVIAVGWANAKGQKVKVVVKGVRTWNSSSRVGSNAPGSVKLTVPTGTYKVIVTIGSTTVVKTQVVK